MPIVDASALGVPAAFNAASYFIDRHLAEGPGGKTAIECGELATGLLSHVRATLAEYKRPRWIEFVTELPKTATGKIQRHKLRDRQSEK